MKEYDVIIIGFGKAGKTLAAKLGAQGKRVALVEKSDQMYGGTCINVGCIPSKSLIENARLSSLWQGTFAQKAERYQKAVEEKQEIVAQFRQLNYDKLDRFPTVTIYHAAASFLAKNRVLAVPEEGEGEELCAERILINTGAAPVIPPIPGIGKSPYVHTSATLMDEPRLPRRLAVIGGGYIGLEFASMYANFGAQVTVLQDGPRLLPREDADMAEAIKTLLQKKGVDFWLGAQVQAVESGADHAVLSVNWQGEERRLPAEAVLVATGRRPNTKDLNLAAAGVRVTENGAVETDELLRTSVPGIWAAGDVAGGLQFTYVSLDDSRIVGPQLYGTAEYTARDRKNVPYSMFIDPPFSRVGMTEAQAREAGYEVRVKTMPAAVLPRAKALGRPEGTLKAVVDGSTGSILGAALLCDGSFEVINTVKLAMDLGADYTVLRDQVFTHPVMSEALNDLFDL